MARDKQKLSESMTFRTTLPAKRLIERVASENGMKSSDVIRIGADFVANNPETMLPPTRNQQGSMKEDDKLTDDKP